MDNSQFEDFNRYIDALPPLIENPLLGEHVNPVIRIYRGEFKLALTTGMITLNGEIWFSFKPNSGVRFKGNSNYYSFDNDVRAIEIPDAAFTHGQALITHIGGNDHLIKGIINNPAVILERSDNASELIFSLPNFQDTGGSPVRSGNRMMANRLTFEDAEWLIELDQVPHAAQIKKDLKNEGGYGLNYTGRLTKKTGTFDYKKSVQMIGIMGQFFSFLNGRRCFPCIIQASDNGKVCWNDYSSWHADTYKEESSWMPQNYSAELSDLWQHFCAASLQPDDQECLEFLIHWYVEAINNSGFAEGSVVFLQNAFELLFNWQIVEKDGSYTAGQAKSIHAARKIRELMLRAGISPDFATKYNNLIAKLRQLGLSFTDFPELFTLMRNAVVHANVTKRKKLSSIPSMARFHIRQMGIHCLELLILHILNYQGKYANRTSENIFRGGNDEAVPWAVVPV